MKKRISRVLNFFAFNLLFFALYLNFIHKDSSVQTVPVQKITTVSTNKGTVLVSNPDQYLKEHEKNSNSQTATVQN